MHAWYSVSRKPESALGSLLSVVLSSVSVKREHYTISFKIFKHYNSKLYLTKGTLQIETRPPFGFFAGKPKGGVDFVRISRADDIRPHKFNFSLLHFSLLLITLSVSETTPQSRLRRDSSPAGEPMGGFAW